MEGIFRSEEMDKIEELYNKAWNLNSGIVFFPIRHHSPACSFHLKKIIEEYMPQAILIEGPSDANKVKEYLCHDDTKAPVCLYYSYSDSRNYLNEEQGKYMCYYPFLDYSPELVALREAKLRGIEAFFIDLPYAEILINSEKNRGLRKKEDKNSYNDDYFLEHSKFMELLCEKQNCRSFHELWEKLFEIDGLKQDSGVFVKNVLADCFFTRLYSTHEELEAEGCLAREAYMSRMIQEYSAKYEKVLVITGGFHTSGLIERMGSKNEIKFHSFNEKDIGIYEMAYSFEACDQLNGYASGMPHPAFYQKVWENILDKEEKPYERAVLYFIARCGGTIRKKEGSISTAEEIEAYNMAQGLAAFRDKKQCGVYELIDGVRSAFIKGELNMATDAPFKILSMLLTGRKTGKLCTEADIPPLLADFRAKAESFRLKINTTVEQEIILEIYKTEKHRQESFFFHRMGFLKAGFGRLIKGPDFVNRKNTNLIRETWKYKWNIETDSTLIENSVYGGTLNEVCTTLALKIINENNEHAGEVASILVNCFMMGLEDIFIKTLPSMADIIAEDGDFSSLVQCIYKMNILYHMRRLYNMEDISNVKRTVLFCYNKLMLLIPGTFDNPKDQEDNTIDAMKNIYQVVMDRDMELDYELLGVSLLSLVSKKDGNPAIEGAALGLLCGMNAIDTDYVVKCAEGYMFGTGEKFLKSASFLKGLFSTSRDIIFNSIGLIAGIDNVMRNLAEEDFLRLIPELRLSFSFFSPSELDEISRKAAGLYGLDKDKISGVKGVNPSELEAAEKLDSYAKQILMEWGIVDE